MIESQRVVRIAELVGVLQVSEPQAEEILSLEQDETEPGWQDFRAMDWPLLLNAD